MAAMMEICVCPEFVLTVGGGGVGGAVSGVSAHLPGRKNNRLPTVDTLKSAFRKVWGLRGPENKTKPWHPRPHIGFLDLLGSV